MSDTVLNPDLHNHLLSEQELDAHERKREKDPCPPIDPSVIEWLLRQYPLKSYTPTMSLGQIMFEEGKREVVENLAEILQLQQQEDRDEN